MVGLAIPLVLQVRVTLFDSFTVTDLGVIVTDGPTEMRGEKAVWVNTALYLRVLLNV